MLYIFDNFETINNHFWVAVLILFVGFIILLKIECRKQKLEETDIADILKLMKTFSLAILMAFVYMIVSSYEYFYDTSILIILFAVFWGFICLIKIQNQDTNGVATSEAGLSGAIFFASAILVPWFFIMCYICKIIYIYIRSREDNNKKERNNKILASLVKIFSIIIIIVVESVVDCFAKFSFEQKLIYYSSLLVVTEIFFPCLENLLLDLMFKRFIK